MNKKMILLAGFASTLLLICIYQKFTGQFKNKIDVRANSESVNGSRELTNISSMFASSSSNSFTSSLESLSSSSKTSSVVRLSYPKVDPAPQVKYFLESMDKGALPKIQLPKLQKDTDFDYSNATPEQLKQKALEGDVFAAYKYADYIRTHMQHFKKMPDGSNNIISMKENSTEYTEMRDFYMHALLGGAKQAAFTLSKEYLNPYSFDPIESFAWRKISFATGESEKWDCLRDSTTCVVKDFNNLNRVEYFFPCIEDQYPCRTEDFEDATLRAMQYIQSYTFSPGNEIRK